ncbi:hypothetical protein BGZ83_006058 [Gryganskiella cystojenkinii]|nr:hypothetical protein BGZ83_006058 [Gryganskiella cystojenkinii]
MPSKPATKRKRTADPSKRPVKRSADTSSFAHEGYHAEDDDPEDEEDEINTIKDYEEAVRRRHLSSATDRYEEHIDNLAFAAELMMGNDDINHRDQAGEQETPVDQPSRAPRPVVFSLGTFCLFSIAQHFKQLAHETAPSAPGSARAQSVSFGGQRIQVTPGAEFRTQVNHLPDYLAFRLFKYLRHAKPELLSTRVWTRLFFPQASALAIQDHHPGEEPESSLTELDLEGLIPTQVMDNTINGYLLRTIHIGPNLERINLNYQDSLSDKILAQLVSNSPRLRRLSLKGCTNVGDLTLASLPGDSLEELNISFVRAPTVKGIKSLLLNCRELRVLKVASLVNIRDAIFLELEKDLAEEEGFVLQDEKNSKDKIAKGYIPPLHQLENIKISNTKLGDRGLKVLLGLCRKTLRRLDISSTEVKKVAVISQYCVQGPEEEVDGTKARRSGSVPTTNLEKINLTRLKVVSPADLMAFFEQLPPHSLHTLLAGYLTCGQVPIRDELVHRLVTALEPDEDYLDDEEEDGNENSDPGSTSSFLALNKYPDPFAPLVTPAPTTPTVYHLHTLSLFGNSQVGTSKRTDFGLHLLFQRLRPYLRRLELGYTRCHSQLLEALLPQPQLNDDDHTRVVAVDLGTENWVLEELGLDETPIDDDAADILSRMPMLKRLSLQNTRIGKEGVKKVIENCLRLTNLDLTSCRGIPLLERRSLLKEVRQSQARQS